MLKQKASLTYKVTILWIHCFFYGYQFYRIKELLYFWWIGDFVLLQKYAYEPTVNVYIYTFLYTTCNRIFNPNDNHIVVGSLMRLLSTTEKNNRG